MSKGIAFIEDTHDKEWESDNHHHRECDIEIGAYFPVVPEHDRDISEVPPEIYPEKYEHDEYQYEIPIAKWFHEIGEHMKKKFEY